MGTKLFGNPASHSGDEKRKVRQTYAGSQGFDQKLMQNSEPTGHTQQIPTADENYTVTWLVFLSFPWRQTLRLQSFRTRSSETRVMLLAVYQLTSALPAPNQNPQSEVNNSLLSALTEEISMLVFSPNFSTNCGSCSR